MILDTLARAIKQEKEIQETEIRKEEIKSSLFRCHAHKAVKRFQKQTKSNKLRNKLRLSKVELILFLFNWHMLITHSNGFRKNIFNYILYFDHIHPPYPFLANLSFPREPLPIYFHSCLNINEFVYAPTHTYIKFSIHMRENIIVFVNLAYFASYDTVFLDK